MTDETHVSEESGASPEEAAPAPHSTSLVVWDGPSPAVADTTATVKIGVKCALGCAMSGLAVSVQDQAGQTIGQGILGDVLPGTDGLYWTTLTFRAPAGTGVFRYVVMFNACGDGVSHLGARGTFSFRTDPPPDHHVTVSVLHQVTQAPLEDVEVRFGLYAGTTSPSGQVRFALPAGTYTCTIRKIGFEAEPVTVDVHQDLDLCVHAAVGLTQEEFWAKLSSIENHPWG